ncbi:MAG: hypothetical protein AVDCRST_MAG88-769, partial [uncultured Thermomicrobiales bacterium]
GTGRGSIARDAEGRIRALRGGAVSRLFAALRPAGAGDRRGPGVAGPGRGDAGGTARSAPLAGERPLSAPRRGAGRDGGVLSRSRRGDAARGRSAAGLPGLLRGAPRGDPRAAGDAAGANERGPALRLPPAGIRHRGRTGRRAPPHAGGDRGERGAEPAVGPLRLRLWRRAAGRRRGLAGPVTVR